MNILEKIVAQKHRELSLLDSQDVSGDLLEQAVQRHGPRRKFAEALRPPAGASLSLIAEVKKASPSAGIIREDFHPVRIAQTYEAAGASCLSVLTDETFFQGSLQYLRDIRNEVALPLLRKDFIIDPRQILEAIEWGADAILLIVAILSEEQLRDFHEMAQACGLAALVEVHDEEELDRALDAGASLIGVNNRNLKTFQVDLGVTEHLAMRLQERGLLDPITLVAESGIHSRPDVQRLERAGARAILVGESLMRQTDISSKVKELIGAD